MALVEFHPTKDHPADDLSVSSAIEHIVAGSQGLITKRIDLALLEGQDLLSRTIARAALVGAAITLAAAAWFAVAGAFVLFVVPGAGPVMHLVAFGLLNGGGAVGLVGLAMHRGRRQTQIRAKAVCAASPRQPLPAQGKD